MRVLSAAAALLAFGSATAFVPQAPKTPSVENKVNVFQAVQKLLLAPAVMFGVYSGPMIQPVHADGAVSAATVTRASALYGPRVIALKEAVNKGDFDVLKKEDGAVRLFNSGGFAMNKPQQKKVQAAYKDVQDAVAKKDSAALKSAWGTYFKTAGLDKTNPFSLKDAGQAYSADFDFRHNNKNFDKALN